MSEISVADPESLAGSWFLPILDPGSRIQKQQQKRGVKKFCCHTFFCSHKFNKIENYFIFEMLKKTMWAFIQRIIELFTQTFVTKLTKILLWDPGSEIRKKPIPDPGSEIRKKPIPDPGSGSSGQKGTGSRIRNRNTVSNNGKVIIFYLRTSAPSSDDSARQQAMRAINTAAASWVRRKSYLNKS